MVRSVFRIALRTSAREFESVETSPGFAQLLGENLVSLCTLANRLHDASKKIVKSLEVIIVISRKKVSTYGLLKLNSNESERKT